MEGENVFSGAADRVVQVGQVHGDLVFGAEDAGAPPFAALIPAGLVEGDAVIGRDAQFGEVVEAVAGRDGGYVLVEAPAGFGKTTFAAELWRRLERDGRPDVAGFFVRSHRGDDPAASFLGAVCAQLRALLARRAGDLDTLWTAAAERASADRPLLLIVDGLDEAPAVHGLLPETVPPHVHVLVTSRPSPDATGLVPPGHPLRAARRVRLPEFTEDDVRRLLEAFTAERDLAARVLAATRGEPLLARCTAEDIARRGPEVLDAYARERPSGVRDYFHWQLRGLEAAAADDATWDVLALLLAARDGLTALELADVLGLPAHRVRRAIEPIGRFLTGRERHELMHAELSAALAERFSPAERRAAEARLVAWCRRYAEAGWPDDTPDYIAFWGTSHLLGDRGLARRLVDRRWLELRMARTYSAASFTADMRAVLDAHGADDTPEAIGTALAGVNARGIVTAVPTELLGILVEVGEGAKAEAHAALIEDAAVRSRAFEAIAARRWRKEEHAAARRALGRAVAAADQLDGERWAREERLTELVLTLLDAGARDEAAGLLRSRPGHFGWTAVGRLAGPLVRAGLDAVVFELLDRPGMGQAYGEVCLALAESGHLERALGLTDRFADADHAPATFARLAILAADQGEPATAHDLAMRADRAGETGRPVIQPVVEKNLVFLCGALTRVGEVGRALSRLTTVPRSGHGSRHTVPEADWSGIGWSEFSGWAPGAPLRDAVSLMAAQAVKGGIPLEEALGSAHVKVADQLRAALAIIVGGPETAIAAIEGRIEVLIARANAAVATDSARAVRFARELVGLGAALEYPDGLKSLAVFRAAATVLARAGAREEAFDVADRVPTNNLEADATFEGLAEVLGELGDEREIARWHALKPRVMSVFGAAVLPGSREAVRALVAERDGSRSYRAVKAALDARTEAEFEAAVPAFDALLGDRARAIVVAIGELLRDGRVPFARRLAVHGLAAASAQPLGDRERFLAPAARYLALNGDIERACALARRGDRWWHRAPTLARIIADLLDAGETSAALGVLNGATEADGGPELMKQIVERLFLGGMSEHLVHLGPAAEPAIPVAGERLQHRAASEERLAALVAAPDGTDPGSLEGLPGVRETVERLIRAGRLSTALNVAYNDRPYGGDEPWAPAWAEVAVLAAEIATAAYPSDPDWAGEVVEQAEGFAERRTGWPRDAGSEANKARALAALAGFPGRPPAEAAEMFVSALRITLGWNRFVFFSVLEAGLPYLSRLDDGGALDRVLDVVFATDAWWSAQR
ncbi:NACHT domain-containing protein [Spirillospora sp. CA-294931]|uniref:NACHT domain-containing protein n=1 Tax=Spirillospora sp. CA-294931 TaxID=3240042 RepID=UPI003D8D5703